ncbi:sugar phosphate isomerase/epimerase [Clostridium sp. chh4-2]|uniref:sugar phosphate isomerase/epimerase family protein n=1 Tax=Clostridium sp. chh4-2 TaxID=2067550 RepID=UPI000CCF9CF4|nr:sugar phosphate isomerase/epimerase [Clostridium sp. chh4-2]PNV61370.1 sugar phosphate isomerase/epimerase [Clostridium sp. chh4-2]
MRLGFLTNSLVEEARRQTSEEFQSLDQVADWAVEHGFSDLECGPSLVLDEAVYEKVLSEGKINITALIYCRNYLSSDEAEAGEHIAQLKRRIEFAGKLGIEKVITSTGIDKTIEEGIYDRDPAVKDRGNMIRRIPVRSMEKFLETFNPVLELAEKKNVKICFENCPLMGNIAISPVMWHRIFEKLDSGMVGLAYDPSHLVWEMMDPYEPVQEFADRIFHFHAKDTAIDRKQLSRTGILTDFSWWNYRIPGRGEIDWNRMFGELKKINYNGTISIEHEDKDYEGSLEAVAEGILKSREFLNQYL